MPLIEAKLAQPRARPGVVLRPRLFEALDRLDDRELTLLSAHPGSGKTVLVSSWLAGRSDLARAWVTLDPGDDDPLRLWTYVAHAVDRIRPGIARPALARLRTPRTSVETAIDELLNGLAGYDGRVVIVLDDLHHVRDETGLRLLGHAVERLPPTARIVATTRADPAGLRLGLLRARGSLGELRARHLAFTAGEARTLLVDWTGIALDDSEVDQLVERTEGWPAGVSLAALWLAGADAPGEGVQQFSGDQRHVADYLTSEVLDALDDGTRSFLLFTSIFGRFTAPLCDAVLGTDDADRRLEALERSNLFLVPLDGRGTWYRYHHLFRELLRVELARTHAGETSDLHRRATRWLADQGLVEEALEHAEATGDPSAVADLLLAEYLGLIRSGAMDVLTTWLDRVPEDELARRPVLAAAGALAGGLQGQPAARRRRLAAVAEAGMGELTDDVRDYVRTIIAIARGVLLDGDLGIARDNARTAAELGRTRAPVLAVSALAALAFVHFLDGDAAAARELVDEALARPDASQHTHGLIYAHGLHALLESDAGRPHTAESEARQAVALAQQLGLGGVWSAGIAHHALGTALLTLGRAREAEVELERAVILRHAPEPRLDHAQSLVALAEARIARGRLALAAAELEAACEDLSAFVHAGRVPAHAAEVERLLNEALAGSEHAVERPSLAELAVLRLLEGDLSQREIGSELFLSVNTVKTHTRSLYQKLGVTSREAAVRKASTLGLFESADSPG